MSITQEMADAHQNDSAVLCCRTEAGTVLAPSNLEDPDIFPDLEDSNLLTIPNDVLTIKQVLGATLKETTDALTPLTKEMLDNVQYVADEAEDSAVSSDEVKQDNQAASIEPQKQSVGSTTAMFHLHIDEGKGIDLTLPLAALQSESFVAPQSSQQVVEEVEKDEPGKPSVESSVDEKVMRQVRHDHLKIEQVQFGDETKIEGTTLYIRHKKALCQEAVDTEELVLDMDLDIITPEQYGEYSETIMDVQPLATKVEGEIGEGVTRVLDGVVFVVTGTDEDGVQIGEFGSSEGELDRNIMWGRPGAPDKGDIFIKTKVTIKAKANMERPGPLAAHCASDYIAQEIRDAIKKADDQWVVSKEEIVQKRHPNNKKVLIVKEIMGQGAMHDNLIMPVEPVGTLGAKPNVDLGNVPVMLAPTEVLDGGIHALTCIGPASKETSRHYWREPLVKAAMADDEIDLVGVLFVGSPQANTEKYYVSKRLGMLVEAMDIDGAVVTTEGFGNNHIDFASHIEQIGQRGIKVVGDSYCAVQGALVVGNKEMVAMVDNNKSKQGIENEILSNNTLCPEDAIRDLAMLKTLMGGGEIKAPERKWNPSVKQNNIEIIEQTLGTHIELEPNEQSLPKSRKRREIYEKEE